MYKEIIITLVVITLVVIGNIITQNNTNNAVEKLTAQLSSIRENITKENIDEEDIKNRLNSLEETWKNEYDKMAYYIEHEELEKVETEITKLKADIEMKEYNIVVENVDRCAFILEHIKDKTALKIVNIF